MAPRQRTPRPGPGERAAGRPCCPAGPGLAAGADFVLKQHLQRLDQGKLQVLRQAADVVMRLDGLDRLRAGLDDIRINRALAQEFDAVELAGLFFKDADKLAADDLTLLLRVADAAQLIQEAVNGVDINQISIHLIPEDADDLLRLALAQQTVVDMYAGQLLADGADEQRRNDRGIHAAGQGPAGPSYPPPAPG